MWRPWLKSSPKNSENNISSPKKQQQQQQLRSKDNQSSVFRCSSFKDIENLCNIDLDFSNSISTPPNTTNSLKRHPSVPTPTRRSVFHRVRTVNSLLRQWPGRPDPPKQPDDSPGPSPTSTHEETPKTPPQTQPSPEARIVVYYTSLRVVRPTFEACRAVMSILQGFRLQIDERDLAMDLGFLSELRELLGLKLTEELTLPRVFIGGRYIGGAEEVKHLHEIGELKKLVSGIPPKKSGTCDTCGGYRFILCAQCSGSRKIFSEKIGFRCCLTCNENGLIRCPRCSSPPLIRPILAPINGC